MDQFAKSSPFRFRRFAIAATSFSLPGRTLETRAILQRVASLPVPYSAFRIPHSLFPKTIEPSLASGSSTRLMDQFGKSSPLSVRRFPIAATSFSLPGRTLETRAILQRVASMLDPYSAFPIPHSLFPKIIEPSLASGSSTRLMDRFGKSSPLSVRRFPIAATSFSLPGRTLETRAILQRVASMLDPYSAFPIPHSLFPKIIEPRLASGGNSITYEFENS